MSNKEQIQEQEKQEITEVVKDLNKIKLDKEIKNMTSQQRENLLYFIQGLKMAKTLKKAM